VPGAEALPERAWEVVVVVAEVSAVSAGYLGILCVDWAGCGSATERMAMASESSSALACPPHAGRRDG
jgi:hypothetical protein